MAALTAGPLSADASQRPTCSSSPTPPTLRWERTVGGSPVLSVAEIEAVAAFVAAGGGLVVLGETEEDKYGANLSELLERFRPCPRQRTGRGLTCATTARRPGSSPSPHGHADETTLLHLVRTARFYRAGALRAEREGAIVLRAGDDGATRPRPVCWPRCATARAGWS